MGPINLSYFCLYLIFMATVGIWADLPFISLDELLPLNPMQRAPLTAAEDSVPYLNQEIRTRGFVYEWDSEHSVLALQPNLKSCCVGSYHQRGAQILLKDYRMAPATISAIEIRGILRQDSVFAYAMENVAIVHTQPKNGWMTAGLACLGLGLFVFRRVRRNKKIENEIE